MADHVREQIAVAFIAAITGLATTGARVYRDRDTEAEPLDPNTELPALVVEDDGDPAEIITLGNSRILERQMRVTVTAHVKALSGASTQLNQILKELEIALALAPLGGAKYSVIASVAQRESSAAGDQPAKRQSFGFDLLYYTQHDVPDVAL